MFSLSDSQNFWLYTKPIDMRKSFFTLNSKVLFIFLDMMIQKFKNVGARLNASTIGDWFAASTEVLKPIYDNLRDKVMATDYILVDENKELRTKKVFFLKEK